LAVNTYSFVHDVPVEPAVVWEVASDHPGMVRWTPLRRVEMEAGGRPHPHGVGAVRALHVVGPPIREEITAYEPDRRLAYRALSGVPAKDYTGEITLEPTSTGTRLTWSLRFKPLFPGAQFGIAAFIRLAARSLAKEATRRGAGATR
jgi:uncharacterized protein YndB with AHSA1/START domain